MNKKLLSILTVAALLISALAIPSVFAAENESNAKISETLQAELDKLQPDDKVQIYVWIKDIDYSPIESIAEEKAGVKYSELEEMSSNLMALDREGKTEEAAKLRTELNTLVDKYLQCKREATKEAHLANSNKVLSELDLSEENIIFQSKYSPMLILEVAVSDVERIAANENVVSVDYYEDENTSVGDTGYDSIVFNGTIFEKTEKGVTLTVQSDKTEYNVGDKVVLRVSVKNNTDSNIYWSRSAMYHNNAIDTIINYDSDKRFVCEDDGLGGNAAIDDRSAAAGETINQTVIFTGKYYVGNGKTDMIEPGEYNGMAVFNYSFKNTTTYGKNDESISVDFTVKYVDNSSTSGNASTSGDAQPADIQLDVTEVGAVGDNLAIDDTTKLYATIRNNGSEAGEAKVTVNFSIAGQTVDTQTYEVNLEPGKSTVVTSTKDWTADIGTWAVRADISQDGQPTAKARAAGQKYIKARISVAD